MAVARIANWQIVQVMILVSVRYVGIIVTELIGVLISCYFSGSSGASQAPARQPAAPSDYVPPLGDMDLREYLPLRACTSGTRAPADGSSSPPSRTRSVSGTVPQYAVPTRREASIVPPAPAIPSTRGSCPTAGETSGSLLVRASARGPLAASTARATPRKMPKLPPPDSPMLPSPPQRDAAPVRSPGLATVAEEAARTARTILAPRPEEAPMGPPDRAPTPPPESTKALLPGSGQV